MKKFLPLHLAIFSIALFCGLIAQHEWHLRDSQSIYVELAPADPRSILQGDYMALNYDLHFSALAAEKRLEQSEPKISIQDFENQSRVLSYVQLDEKGRVVRSSFDRSALDQPRSAQLILKIRRIPLKAYIRLPTVLCLPKDLSLVIAMPNSLN